MKIEDAQSGMVYSFRYTKDLGATEKMLAKIYFCYIVNKSSDSCQAFIFTFEDDNNNFYCDLKKTLTLFNFERDRTIWGMKSDTYKNLLSHLLKSDKATEFSVF